MKTLWRILAVSAALLLASRAEASTQGRVTGKVTDSAGQPIPDVTVTVTTPSIKIFKLTVKTDKKGAYGLIVNDATLRYHMRFEREGYNPVERDEKFSTGDITVVDEKLVKPSEAPAARGAAPVSAPPPSKSDTAVKAFNEGVELWNAGDKDGAEKKFQDAVSKNPELPQAWQLLARAAYDKKDWAKAQEYGQKALDLDPSATDLYSLMSSAALNAGDKKSSEEWRKKYEEANPDTPVALYNKGVEALNKKKIKEAEAYFEKAVAAKPDFAIAHYQLGLVSFNQNKKTAAREHLQKYLELDPKGGEAGTAKELLEALK
jgi:tetratricopeptide (TPR) repeat protein